MDLEKEVMEELYKIFDRTADQIQFTDERGDRKHFLLNIISDRFFGINRVQRSRMVYQALDQFLTQDRIHALRMTLKTTEEENLTTNNAQQ